ncbi:MAG: MotA/TolQ/ExbB proton channel family protein [Methylomonas sp.]|nr:MotA/TolQ/ExbB proton channel family protein [Methylomonas sp.]PPD20718.1 MAG: flagellar motor protein MotA [Methylomonas sp.]PPD26215.1 MAG: flagellar motor protein MotA [Methylomonas sp.]PPD37933.1 MAG: flagellar motor protein MotA [Methylomonas sp.]PPD38967.1 MAG: flagellar motor protein MotA [Methylomonas sp.]
MPFHVSPTVMIDGTLYTLLLFSLVTWTLIFFKVWQFAKNSHYNQHFSHAFWDARDLQAAQQLPPETTRGPKARIAASGFAWLEEIKHPELGASLKFRGSPQDLLEQTLRKQTQIEQKKMESGLTMLASIGSTAPFVGLFGTVVGIMNALHDISASGSASLDVVAGPIGDALIATAVGIAVAVPAVLAYNFFLRRAKHHRASLEHFVDGFLHIAFGDNYMEKNKGSFNGV